MYDRGIIERYAYRMYARAARQTVASTLGGFLVGVVFARWLEFSSEVLDLGIYSYVSAGALGAFVGYFVGEYFAFRLRFQAQVALCQLEQEKHLSALAFEARTRAQPALAAVAPANANAA